MSDDVIASDNPLTASQLKALPALLDTILPASDDGRMPSAGELDFVGYLQAKAGDFVPALAEILDGLGVDFLDLPFLQRYALVEEFSRNEPVLFEQLLLHLYGCYYQDDRALEGLGLGAGPPFPRGNEVEPGDLALLDPVLRSSRTYRR